MLYATFLLCVYYTKTRSKYVYTMKPIRYFFAEEIIFPFEQISQFPFAAIWAQNKEGLIPRT